MEETAAATESLDLDAMLAEDAVTEESATVPNDVPPESVESESTEDATASDDSAASAASAAAAEEEKAVPAEPEQSGPFIDLLGSHLYSLEMIDETQAQLVPQYTNEALVGKKVVGLYFSADWCGPCR